MKKVINGRLYDTTTATPIESMEFGDSSNHQYIFEELYKTKKGNFFLYYTGGARSKYAVNEGPNLVGGSSGIRLLTPEEALQWCEINNVEPDVIEQHFVIKEG